MLTLENPKNKVNDWNQKLSKYSKYANKFSIPYIYPVLIQKEPSKDDNCDIYLSNQTKTQTSKTSLLRTQIWKQKIFPEQFLLQTNTPYKSKAITIPKSTVLLRQAELKEIFIKLAHQWRSETKHMSLMSDIILHTAYQQIIGMGADAVPFILEELSKEPEHWFWALRSITGVNPIKPEDRGRLKKMAEAWLDWGKQHGYKC
jgi:hypothetical protein